MSRLLWVLGLASIVTAARADPPVILILGDSLSAAYGISADQGWVHLLERRLADQALAYRVVNASISGETTVGGVARLPGLLAEHRPEVLIVALGANDGLRGFPLNRMRDNLERLASLGLDAGARVLLVGVRLPPNYGAAYGERFQGTFRDAAESRGVALVPRLLEGVAEDWGLMQADGYHPTAEAQPRMLDNVWVGLQPLLAPVDGGVKPASDQGRIQ